MYQQRKLLYLYCETPLHAGSGSELGIVDLPIQRERHTGYPKIEASSLKGAVREHFCRLGDGEKDAMVGRTFGPAPDSEDANKFAGCIAFTDARLLCMPVRSAAGVWTWITCPGVLARFAQDLGLNSGLPKPTKLATGQAMVTQQSANLVGPDKLVLEEYAFEAIAHKDADAIATAIKSTLGEQGIVGVGLDSRLTVLADEDFAYFAENATEVVTRIRISQATGTVDQGALWTEEYLPSESILYTVALASGEFQAKDDDPGNRMEAAEVMNYLTDTLSQNSRFQLGANATLGKGHLFAAFAKTSNT